MTGSRSAGAALILTLAGLLAACSDASDGSGQAVPVVVQVSGEPEETAVYEAIATAYNATDPAREVEIVPVAKKDDHLALLQTSFAAGQSPEVFLVNYREYASFVERGAVAPIGAAMADRGVDLADYYAPPVQAFTLDGDLQCMPQNVSSLVVYVNTALFEAAGLAPAYDGWTFEEFRAAAATLTAEEVDGVYVEPSIIRLAPFAWSNGGEIVDDAVAPTELTLDDPATHEALQGLIDLQRTDQVMPTDIDLAAAEAEVRFMEGRLAMILSSRKSTPLFREAPDLEFDVVPLPAFGTQPVSILHSDAYCVSTQADGDQADAAADFVAFATGSNGQRIAALGGRTVPSLREVAESGAFLNPTQEPAHNQVFLDAIPSLRATPVTATWPEIEDVIEEYLTRAWYDDDGVGPVPDLPGLLAELDGRLTPLFGQP
jgi:multiple sugar transport system substrate-binding protein